jgi:putative nucleotidyltransferase with HDIG domain
MKTLDEIRPVITALKAIPTIPAIIQPLASMLRLPVEQVDVEEVVRLVSYDSSIAAQCLRMANSALFGRRKAETVRSAILALGLKRVQAILLGCCLNRIVPADRWAFDAETFWRHSLGCALVSRKLATLIGYVEPEKAYLAGLLHDLGILVNTVACTEEYRMCIVTARQERIALESSEQKVLGFTHCDSGKILAEHWKFPPDVIAVIEHHHHVVTTSPDPSLVSLVHLSDLLCRLGDLGYGYYEAMAVELAEDAAWANLVRCWPRLADVDLARFSLDIEGTMQDIVTTVDAVFRPGSSAAT